MIHPIALFAIGILAGIIYGYFAVFFLWLFVSWRVKNANIWMVAAKLNLGLAVFGIAGLALAFHFYDNPAGWQIEDTLGFFGYPLGAYVFFKLAARR